MTRFEGAGYCPGRVSAPSTGSRHRAMLSRLRPFLRCGDFPLRARHATPVIMAGAAARSLTALSAVPREMWPTPLAPHQGVTANKAALRETCRRILDGGRGILAADESDDLMESRLQKAGKTNTDTNRDGYRGAMYTSSGWEDHIGGVILNQDSFHKHVAQVRARKVCAGITLDRGLVSLPGTANEAVNLGVDRVLEDAPKFQKLGASFAKYRAALQIRDEDAPGISGFPSDAAIGANVAVLARFASGCQANGLVPIVEPDLGMEGNHSAVTTKTSTSRVLRALFKELHAFNVELSGCLLKVNFAVPGFDWVGESSYEEVARLTVDMLIENVPAALPGIVFLSGGLSDEASVQLLDACNKRRREIRPDWPVALSFSFGRALQGSALKGYATDVATCQKKFVETCAANAAAARGELPPTKPAK